MKRALGEVSANRTKDEVSVAGELRAHCLRIYFSHNS